MTLWALCEKSGVDGVNEFHMAVRTTKAPALLKKEYCGDFPTWHTFSSFFRQPSLCISYAIVYIFNRKDHNTLDEMYSLRNLLKVYPWHDATAGTCPINTLESDGTELLIFLPTAADC